jgi:hypothetical protein
LFGQGLPCPERGALRLSGVSAARVKRAAFSMKDWEAIK